LLVALLGLAAFAQAGQSPFHRDLSDLSRQLDATQGPEVYATLRKIWGTWDRADPSHVEEALRAAAHDDHLSAPARAYAATLSALGRARRGDLKAARDSIRALGYVDQWLIVGPFDNEGKAGLDTPSGPEPEQTQAIVPGKAYTGKERPVRYRPVPAVFPYGFLDAGSLVRPESKVCVFATSFVSAPSAGRKLSVWAGAGGAFKLFWNGELVLQDSAYRGHDYDRSATAVDLEPGPNQLTLKLCGDDQSPVGSVRVAGPDGAPDASLTFSNGWAESLAYAKAFAQKKPPSKLRAHAGPDGPIQLFQKLTRGKQTKPAALEAFARYLAETGGDDPARHEARDFAKQAADSEPTVRRLLLAGRLAEDRNQTGEWLKKAEALAAREPQPNRDVLLARALDRRTSPNWRDAFPFFDRVLAIDPDDALALRGRVELYNLAGLPRTALSTLEGAVARNPNSVNLLNMYASQLRMLGRTTDAAEAESRYSALRFDDAGFMSQMIELASARRDRAAAERWLDRLLETHPDGLWALSLAARTYRSLGQPERAIAAYRRALLLAPEDAGTLRALADLDGELGRKDEQLALLQDILRVRPQDKDVREYVEHLEPQKPRADEAYAWESSKFLKLRHAPANGQNRRVLRDLTVSTVFDNGLSSSYRQIVFQPLSDAAAAAARQYAFGYEADSQAVQLRGARVYRGDGRVDEAIESGEGPADDPSIATYTSARTFYVQFPRLEPGDVVELRYRVDDVTPKNDFGNYFGEITYLQGQDPVQNAEYVLITPKSRTFYIDQNVPELLQTSEVIGNQRLYHFFAAQVPAVTPEPAMPPLQEVLGFVHVSTYKDWKDLGHWYWGLVKDQFDLDDETRKLAKKITLGKTSDIDKVKAVYEWVTRNTRYVALEFGIYGYKPRRCVQTVARGWGDCKDKATVITTLLNELGIPTTMVVLRTQMKGDFRSSIASFAPFDHAIAYVPSMNLYLDGTAELTGINELPRMDIGALGLLLNQGNTEITHVPNAAPEKNFVRREVKVQLAKGGEAKLEFDYSTGGYNAPQWRSQYQSESTRNDRINNDLGREFPGFEIAPGGQGIQTSDLSQVEEPVHIKVRGAAPSFARREGKQLSMVVTESFRLTPNYASLSQRRHDVRLLAFSTLEDQYTIKLPPGSKVISAPSDAAEDGPFGSYSVTVQTDKDQVTVSSRVLIKVGRVTPRDYPAWKNFCEAADRALSPRLVIE
jgi:tetratricopeptide (TPR) repeat protein/transglutaminase-like putative cysteine protease